MVTGSYPPDWRRLCEELVNELEFWRSLGEVPDCLARARAALAQPESEPVGPSDEELWQVGDEDFRANTWPTDAIRYARAVLARFGGRPAPAPTEGGVGEPPAELVQQWYDAARGPRCEQEFATQAARWGAAQVAERQAAPVPAEDVVQAYQAGRRDAEADARQAAEAAEGEPAGEVAEAIADLRECADSCILSSKPYWASPMRRAADLLERQSAPVPVAVSERWPEFSDCDAQERLWCSMGGATWELRQIHSLDTHWLPAHALPLPSGKPSHE